MEKKIFYDVFCWLDDGSSVCISVCAHSRWEAIDRAYNQLCHKQKDRTKFKIKGGNK
jgi:hypothetical protein